MTSIVVGATYYDYTEDLEYVALPFPSPDSFDGDVSGAIVFWNSQASRYEYWVAQVDYSDSKNSGVTYTRDGLTLQANTSWLKIINDSDVTVTAYIYRFWYYPSQSVYHFWSLSEEISAKTHYSYTGPSDNVGVKNTVRTYGDVSYYFPDGDSVINIDVAYTFNNDISPYVFKQMSSDLGEIKLYCSEILEALGQGDSYVPPETTTNAVIDGYHQAEQELMTNQFNNIDNVVDNLPDFNGGDMGAYNHSFAFISDMMNFVSGNGSGYGSAAPSMFKIAGVILVVLSLGFTSFIIGLVNRRKE